MHLNPTPEDRLERAFALCRSQGLALTVQRRLILRNIAAREDHPTADEVFEAVGSSLPGLSRTTVYRVLETLVRVGALRKLSHEGAVARFDPCTERHHHLTCERCGALVDLPDRDLPQVALPESVRRGFQILDYSINFTGICSRCRRGSSSFVKEKR
jgi:Fur family peroxide stress response transcriptional regulator